MQYYWKGILHFFGANSRHGTHSPFVYRLADEVIYKPKKVAHPFVLAMPEGFNPFYRPLLNDLLHAMAQPALTTLSAYKNQSAILVDFANDTIEDLLVALQKGIVLVVDEPFKDARHSSWWEQLVQDPNTTVAMDLFHFGILLHREEQRKAYFRLRYPYWR